MTFNYNKAQNSPWGKVDTVEKYARGFSYIGTPGHGGFRISRGYFEKHAMDKDYLLTQAIVTKSYIYFEEDCAASLFLFDSGTAILDYCKATGKDPETVFQDSKRVSQRWFKDYFKEVAI
jgi:hypothetical protein